MGYPYGALISSAVLDVNLSANDLLVFLNGYSDDYRDLLIDKLGWGGGYCMLRWPLSKKGALYDNFCANENNKWHGSIQNIRGLHDMHGRSDLLNLYVGKLSPKTARMYIEQIMQFDQPRCTDIHRFKHYVCKTVKAYNEHEKINDFAKQKCGLRRSVPSPIYFGWHPLLNDTFDAMHATKGLWLTKLSETYLDILKNLPVHVAESVFRVAIAKKREQAGATKLTKKLIYEAFPEVSLKRNLKLSQYAGADYAMQDEQRDADFFPEPV